MYLLAMSSASRKIAVRRSLSTVPLSLSRLASRDNERGTVLRDLRTAILRDADDIASKYIRQNSTSNYAVLYIASEKLIDLVDDIENLRQDCLAEKKVLIQGLE